MHHKRSITTDRLEKNRQNTQMTGKMDTIVKIGEKTRTDKEKMENNCDSKIRDGQKQ